MFDQLIDWLIGGILGALIAFAIPWGLRVVRDGRGRGQIRRRSRITQSAQVSEWLIDYYVSAGREHDLYTCRLQSTVKVIPFLTKSTWLAPYGSSEIGTDSLVTIEPAVATDFSVNNKALARRRRLGQRLFDNPSVTLVRIEDTVDFRLAVQPCSYFAVATQIVEIEEETFKAAAARRRTPAAPKRNKHLGSVDIAARLARQPTSLGCAFLLAFSDGDGGYELLLHKRSPETVSFGGARAAIPNFGMEPLGGLNSRSASGPDLLMSNFYKEYLEELFNYEELISGMSSRRADPYWFLGLPEAKEAKTLREDGRLKIHRLGFGFDALNGNGILAMLGVFDDPSYCSEIRERIELNWEVADSLDGPSFEFVAFDSPKLADWLTEDSLHPGAAFALSRAVPLLVHSLERLADGVDPLQSSEADS